MPPPEPDTPRARAAAAAAARYAKSKSGGGAPAGAEAPPAAAPPPQPLPATGNAPSADGGGAAVSAAAEVAEESDEEMDEELRAALALSMRPTTPPAARAPLEDVVGLTATIKELVWGGGIDTSDASIAEVLRYVLCSNTTQSAGMLRCGPSPSTPLRTPHRDPG